MRRLAISFLLALSTLGAAGAIARAPSHRQGPRLHTSPSLFPRYRPSVSDYVVRCHNRPVSIRAIPAHGGTVSVAGAPATPAADHGSVPLLGDRRFTVTFTANGRARRYQVRCLPPRFPHWSFHAYSRPTARYFTAYPSLISHRKDHYVIIFDRDGVPIWWYRARTRTAGGMVLPNGQVAWSRYHPGGIGTNKHMGYEVHRLDGKLVRLVQAKGAPSDHHEFVALGHGHYLIDSFRPRAHRIDLKRFGGPAKARLLDGRIQEIGPGGRVRWHWSTKGHISLAETNPNWPLVLATPRRVPRGGRAYDYTHLNAVSVVSKKLLLISLRHTDAVYEINRRTGRVVWKLGGTRTRKSLRLLHDPHPGKPLLLQHDVRYWPAGGTISVYDNGGNDRPPRVVRYRVDRRAGTARFLGAFREPSARTSGCCGSARRLSRGHWLVDWAISPLVTESTSSGRVVFALRFAHGVSYRAIPVPSGVLHRSDLRRAMDRIAATQGGQP